MAASDGGAAQADDAGDVFGPGPQARFVPRAVQHRLQCDAVADVQRADAFGGVHLVPGDRQQIDLQLIDLRADLADRLRGVGVQRNLVLVADGGDLPQRLDRADLVVGVHDADQQRIGPDGRAARPPAARRPGP